MKLFRTGARFGSRRPAARVAASLVCMITLSSFAAACGSTPKQADDVATIGTTEPADDDSTGDTTDGTATDDSATDGTGSTDSSTPDSVNPEDAFNEYTQCMRDNGIDMPDAQVVSSGDGNASVVGGGPVVAINSDSEGEPLDDEDRIDPESEEFQAAEAECQPILEAVMSDIEIDPEVEAEHREQMLEFAQCMRDHGIDFPDPEFNSSGGGGVSINIDDAEDAEAGPRPDDEAFQTANEECGQIFGDARPGVVVAASPEAED